jgi:phosphate transport system permease protein
VSDNQLLDKLRKRPGRYVRESSIQAIFIACASLSIVTTIGIIAVLVFDTGEFFSKVPIVKFFTGTRWSPTILPVEFGVLPLISGTITFTLCTAIIALPVGLLAATYLSEYANRKLRAVIKPALEVLAGIPTVVYGYFALVYITPVLRHIFPTISTFNVLSASIVVAVMIITTGASISEDAMRAVPLTLRQAGFALGITKFQVSTTIVIPSALSGIVASFVLGISRVIGETMAVTIAAGNLARMVNPLKPAEAFLGPVQTMTAAMVEIGNSDVSGDSLAYRSLFAIGLTLFVMTLILNLVSQVIKNRFREKYQ